MGVDQQQSTNNGTIIDDAVELRRSKRNVWPEIIGEASGVFDALFGGEHGIEGQNITTVMSQVTERQNATTAMPQATERQNATTQIPPVTRVQNVTTEISPTTEMPLAERYRNASVHSGAEQGDLNMIKYFIENGADINAKNENDDTLLHLAVKEGHLHVVKYLVENGADIDNKNHGKTPLHLAARYGYLDVVKYLVEKGADLMAEDYYGETPLHIAVKRGKLDIVKYLVEKGADVNAKENSGWTPLHLATRNCDVGNVYLDIVKYLVKKGADINAKEDSGKTPLHLAAYRDCLDTVKHLVENGADVNAKNDDNKTPLDLARSSGRSQIVKFLSSHQRGNRGRRDVSNNSWTNNSVVNWVKGLISSTESPALLTSSEPNNHTITATPEVNATLVNNTLLLGVLATSLKGKEKEQKLPVHENLLSPIEQSKRLNNLDMVEKAVSKALSKPSTYIDEVLLRGSKTGLNRR